MTERSEQDAVAQARETGVRALAELYGEYRRRIFGLSYRLLGSREAAEDATSEVFLRIGKSLSSYDRNQPMAAWVMGITSNYCIDLLRRRQREQRIFVPGDPETPVVGHERSPLTLIADQESRERVRHAINQLPDRYRVPLVLRYFAELSYDEISEQTGLKRNHVATLLFRAKDELRRLLENQP